MGWREAAQRRREATRAALATSRRDTARAEFLLADITTLRRWRGSRTGVGAERLEPLLVPQGGPALYAFRRSSSRRLQVAAYREVVEALIALDCLLPARDVPVLEDELGRSCLPAVEVASTLLQIADALTHLQQACASADVPFENHPSRAELVAETEVAEALLAHLRDTLHARREQILAARVAEREAERAEQEARRAMEDLLVLDDPVPRLDPATAAALVAGADALAASTHELRDATEGLTTGTEALSSLRARTQRLLRR